MIAVLYNEKGDIVQTIQGSEATIQAQGKPYVAVSEFRIDYDVHYKVVDGKVVEKPKADEADEG
jgi:hypothetical protein